MIHNRLLSCSRLALPSSRRVITGSATSSLSKRSLVVNYTYAENITTSSTPSLLRNYSSLSEKQFQKIKAKRDEEARLLKEEAERKFIEANKVSIDPLSFVEALQNLKDKLTKYKVVYAAHMATLFKKVKTAEEFEQALLFYKTLRNDRPTYFNASHIQQIYYAAERADQWVLWADVIINAHTFQIFPSQHTIAKTVYQLLRKGDTAKAIELIKFTSQATKLSNGFTTTIGDGLRKTQQALAILPLLEAMPTFNIRTPLIKDILREAIKEGQAEPALAVLGRFIDETLQKEKDYTMFHGTIYSAYIATGNKQLSMPAAVQVNEKMQEIAVKTLNDKLKQASPETQQKLLSNIKQFFGSESSVPQPFQAVLSM